MIRKQSQKGFTIIEVVLVLAIAALIFLIVFLAVPALQRSQRDTQRRSDVGRMVTAITNNAANRQGQLPTTTLTNATATNWVFQYVRANTATEKFEDPRGNTNTHTVSGTRQYAVTVDTVLTPPVLSPDNNPMSVRFGHKCDSNTPGNVTTTTGAGSRNFAVVIPLESGDFYCQDS